MASAAARARRSSGGQPAVFERPLTTLPEFDDLFVGRDQDSAAVAQLLAQPNPRLLTLTGPPGIGKTRLACAAAAAYRRAAGVPVFFVDLSPVRDAALVPADIARVLRAQLPEHTDAVTQITTSVGERALLLVLDNCEHVLGAARDISQVLMSCRRLRVLATSRERFRLAAEQEFPVPPLRMPIVGEHIDPRQLAANPSVALLLARTRRVDPTFALTNQNAIAVAAACAKLEGLPLAIELAAARLKYLTPQELTVRLEQRMQVLASTARDVPARHRALRSAIAWSHELLAPQEQAAFRRLSIFAGVWTIPDAAEVCADDDAGAEIGGSAIPELVESLLDKSLIRRLPADTGIARFAMLATLREYAAEQLVTHGEFAQTTRRHAARFAAIAEQLEATFGLPSEQATVHDIGAHLPDLRAALSHSTAAGQREQALALGSVLCWYGYLRGDLDSARRVLDATRPLLADTATGTAAESGFLLSAGIVAWARDELACSEALLRRALDIGVRDGDQRRSTVARAFLGHIARARGQFARSARLHERAVAGFHGLGYPQGVAWGQHDLGLLARDRGDLDEAALLLRAALRQFRALDYPWAVAWSAYGLGDVLCRQGHSARAGPLLGEALAAYHANEDPRGVMQCLEVLARVACAQAAYESAARLLGAAAGQRMRLRFPPADSHELAAAERTVTRCLGPEVSERLRHLGATMPAGAVDELAMAVAAGQAAPTVDSRAATLTPRERQVATLVASGHSNRQISRALGIAEKTTEAHLAHMMTKLGARNRAEIAAWSARHSTP